jgi:hypothetical protein
VIRPRVGRALLFLWIAGGFWGCAAGEAAVDPATSEQLSTAPGAAPPQSDAETASEAPATATVEPGELTIVAAEAVYGRTGPGGEPFEVALRTPGGSTPHARRFGAKTMRIALRVRTPDLSQYPCTSCHLGAAVVLEPERVADAHQDIQPVHPAETGATCGTCHAAANVELLVLRSGETMTMDHAYRLCAECHFQQADAWAAGGHGKRLDGWQGRRVVMGCADCHDPHHPTLESRVPYPPPRISRTVRREP